MIIKFKKKASAIVQADNLAGRFSRGAFWTLLGIAGLQGSNLLVTIFLARVLGTKGYGEFGMVYSTIIMLGEFAGAGLGLTTTKYISEYKNVNPAKASQILSLAFATAFVLGILVSASFMLFPEWLSKELIKAPDLAPLFRIGALQILFNAMIGVILGILTGLESFKSISVNNFIRGLSFMVVTGISVYFFGLKGAVVATTVSAGISMLVAFQILKVNLNRTGLYLGLQNCFEQFSVLYKYSLPAFLSNIAVVAAVWITNVLLVNQQNGFSELGQLNITNQWKTLLLLLPTIIAQVLVPLLSSELAGKGKKADNTLILFQSITIMVTFPVGVLFMYYADVVLLLYGKDFHNSGSILTGVVWSVIVASVGGVLGSFVQASGKMWIGFATNILYGLLLIAFTYVAADSYGANAVAYGSGIAYFIVTVLSIIWLSGYIPGVLIKQIVYSLLFSVVVLFSCLFLSSHGRLFLGVPAFILVVLFIYTCILSTEVRAKINIKSLLNRNYN